MTIASLALERGISEILHFTTNKGLLGILAAETVMTRAQLPNEQLLEHIYHPNCETRRDTPWLDYVNLSITRINSQLFDISSGAWHRQADVWWCVLAFDPIILSHPDVYFSTTNNMYSGATRAKGEKGLLALFGSKIIRWNGNSVTRPTGLALNQPTCFQAEVLYPKGLSISFLRHVYVATDAHQDVIKGQCLALGLADVPCSVRPDAFR